MEDGFKEQQEKTSDPWFITAVTVTAWILHSPSVFWFLSIGSQSILLFDCFGGCLALGHLAAAGRRRLAHSNTALYRRRSQVPAEWLGMFESLTDQEATLWRDVFIQWLSCSEMFRVVFDSARNTGRTLWSLFLATWDLPRLFCPLLTLLTWDGCRHLKDEILLIQLENLCLKAFNLFYH